MVEKWIESVFIKRFFLALASAAAAHLAAHHVPGPVITAFLGKLSAFGVSVNLDMFSQVVTIDPEKFSDAMSVAVFAGVQGLHEKVAAKWPEVGKYL